VESGKIINQRKKLIPNPLLVGPYAVILSLRVVSQGSPLLYVFSFLALSPRVKSDGVGCGFTGALWTELGSC